MKYTFLAVVVWAMSTATPASAAGQASVLLDEAPADAQLVVWIPSLSGLSDKIATLHDDLGLAVPQMKDVLGELKRSIGAENGLDDQGGMLIAFTDLAGAIQAQSNKPPALLIVAVSDYNQLITSLGGQAGDDVATLTLPAGQPAFAKKSGSYAVLGPDRQMVEGYQRGGQGAAWVQSVGASGEHLDSADVAMIVNIAALAPALEPFINQAADKMGRELAAAKGMAEGPQAEMVEFGGMAMQMYIDAGRAVLRDSQAGLAMFSLTGDGLLFTEAVQFKPESTLGTMFANANAAAEHLARLPDQPYLMAGAWNTRGLALDPLFDAIQRLMDAMPKEVLGGMSEMVESSFAMAKGVKSGAMVYYPPQQMAMMGGGMMMGVAVMQTTDPQAYVQTYKETVTKLNGMSMGMGGMGGMGGGMGDPENPAMPGGGISIVANYKPNVLQVDGVQIDEYKIQYQYPPQMMQQMGPMAPIFMMMGGMGQSGYVAATARYVVMTTTRDAQLIKQAIAAVGGDSGLGADGAIKRVREMGLPADACLESYLSVSGVVGMANMFMGMMGQPPLQAPADLPPVSWGASIKDHAIVGQAYVPIEVMRFGKVLADQLQAMFNPAAMGGAPQGNQGGPPAAPF